jgi:hypothetical protein
MNKNIIVPMMINSNILFMSAIGVLMRCNIKKAVPPAITGLMKSNLNGCISKK